MKRIHLLSACIGCSLLSASPPAVDGVRSTIGEWVAVEQAISREALDWEEDKVLLGDLVAVAETRIAKLEAEVAESEAFASTADAKRLELLDQSDAIEEQAARIETFLAIIEARLRALQPNLPDPLQRALAPDYQRLPEDADATRLGLGEPFGQ